MNKRGIASTLALMIVINPLVANAKGGAGGHASAGKDAGARSANPGAMVDSGASKSSGDTKMVNASAKPDNDAAAKAKPSKKK